MTQFSRPQGGHSDQGFIDSGPYSADQWRVVWEQLFTGDDAATQGVLKNVLNELEVVQNVADIEVDTGYGIVKGTWVQSVTAAHTIFTPAAPAANPRIDVVVMLQNFTATNITAGVTTPNNLIFPNNLTDYQGTASIPKFTCRLAILPGNEAGAPVAPTLDQSTLNLWMTPLAQYQISVVGAISALTDLRSFCRFSTVVDGSQAQEQLPIITERQGSNATDWAPSGTTDYAVVDKVDIQVGGYSAAIGAAASGVATVTFPHAFAADPLVIAMGSKLLPDLVIANVSSATATTATVQWKTDTGVNITLITFNWYAIGERT